MRLALVLDEKTGLPVWYEAVAGNRLDLKTLFFVRDDAAATLGVESCLFVLDSGYVSEELIRGFPETSPTRVLSRQ